MVAAAKRGLCAAFACTWRVTRTNGPACVRVWNGLTRSALRSMLPAMRRKAVHTFEECLRDALPRGIPLRLPQLHPLHPLLALRVTWAAGSLVATRPARCGCRTSAGARHVISVRA
jgi:hypothetical protein